MKILVTGAQGQVGADLVDMAPRYNFNIAAFNKTELDITNPTQVKEKIAKIAPDLVINAAAYIAVDHAENETEKVFAINCHGAANLAQACEKLGIPLFHISTDYVFDGKADTPYQENDDPNPLSVYGVSKLAGDNEVRKIQKHIILRVSWVFSRQKKNFVSTMIKLAHERDKLKIVNDQNGSPTWSGDIATALMTLADQYRAQKTLRWGLYNFSGAPITNWCAFAQDIFDTAYKLGAIKRIPELTPIPTSAYKTVAVRPLNSSLDCSLIHSVFNIEQPDWHSGLENVIQNWRAHDSKT